MSDLPIRPLLREREAARILGVSEAWLQRQRWLGLGPTYVRHGRAIRFEPAALQEWIVEHRHVPKASKPGRR